MSSAPPSLPWELVRTTCLSLGWDDAGVTDPNLNARDIAAYERWLASGHHGRLHYMENRVRTDPSRLLHHVRSIILLVTRYKQPWHPFQKGQGLIASYARGRDYHRLHRKRLKKLIQWLETRVGETGVALGFSDAHPVMEKALAVKAGLGWLGKNTLLIHRRFGTFILLSGVLTSIHIEPPKLTLDYQLPRCGNCSRCIDVCPVGALIAPYVLDANCCLSYHLIESKQRIPPEIAQKNPGYIFGCDLCQDVCPHNQKIPPCCPPELAETAGLGPYQSEEALRKIAENPSLLFGTPLQRRGIHGLLHTLETLTYHQKVTPRGE